MLIVTKRQNEVLNTQHIEKIRLKGDATIEYIIHNGLSFTLGYYDSQEEAKAAFEDLIEQIDEIEGVARVK